MEHFALKPLPYATDALTPRISRETLTLHHEKASRGHLKKLNELIAGTPEERESRVDHPQSGGCDLRQRGADVEPRFLLEIDEA